MTWTVIGWIAFVVILLLSVMLHEFGHFLTARRFGMKATEFFVGFGTRLWSFRRGETEYGIKAIPAGGYVRIVGMTDLEDIPPQDESRAFYRQPAPQRAIVLAAGSFVHFIIAIVLFVSIPMAFGVYAMSPDEEDRAVQAQPPTIAAVADCIPQDGASKCASDDTGPAKQAGIQAGDRIVSVNGKRVDTWQQLSEAISGAPAGPATLVIDRHGKQVTVTPTVVIRKAKDPDNPDQVRSVGRIGVAPPTVANPFSRVGPVDAVQEAGSSFWTVFAGTFKGLGAIPASIPDLVQETFGNKERSAYGPVGPVGLGRVSGQVLGSDAALAKRVGGFLWFMAAINVFIGIFNLLPLLPLDGGHLAVLFFEKARQGIYRLVGRPDPGRVDLTRLLPAAYVFLVFLIGLSVLLLAADIVNPVRLNG